VNLQRLVWRYRLQACSVISSALALINGLETPHDNREPVHD